ncbi:MAG: xanthine dehydrogenase family protein molybdopterin-binding subunit [Gemmatimonadota bacterium]|nr:MAG: xanthine dehydrogenase family protein molybdopterin-binding subunit [Gemmatimonadota bacterium]
MGTITKVSRREFMKATGAAGTGLVLAFYLPLGSAESAEPFTPNAWIRIDPNGTVHLWVHRPDMGQGARTALPMILAEELDVEWPQFERVMLGAADANVYGSQLTGGSTSIRTSWERLRQAGAAARHMLIAAAAAEWEVDPSTCHASKSTVVHEPSGRSLGYGELAERAATMPVPEDPPLKDPEDFQIVGQPMPRLDHPARVGGTLTFGMDVKVPDMLYACVARCPVFGGTVAGYDEAAARAVEGVRDVVEVETGVAVVAESTWAAMKGRDALNCQFDLGEAADLNSAGIAELFERRGADEGHTTRDDGDANAALSTASRVLNATFEVPFLAHATFEPMNCTAVADEERCEIWVPTQAPGLQHQGVTQHFGYAPENVTLHVAYSGGGFGRRILPGYVVEAVSVARAARVPVKVVWTREDDMHHDQYRPASRHILSAGLDRSGNLVAWKHRVVAPSITGTHFGGDLQAAAGEATDGAANLPYAVPNCHVDYCRADTAVPPGWWRSVFNTQNAFANECFIDELATAAGKDPVAFRLAMLGDAPRHRGVLELAAERAGWGEPLPAGRYRGVALHYSFQSWAAQAAEVSVEDGQIRVHRVVCAVDCGIVVNPDDSAAQVEGAIVLGLTAALKGEITVEGGRVVQGNFHDYPLLLMREMPEVETYFVENTIDPTGIGEPPVPPIAPAVANAAFAATGVRVRRLPIRPQDLRRA